MEKEWLFFHFLNINMKENFLMIKSMVKEYRLLQILIMKGNGLMIKNSEKNYLLYLKIKVIKIIISILILLFIFMKK